MARTPGPRVGANDFIETLGKGSKSSLSDFKKLEEGRAKIRKDTEKKLLKEDESNRKEVEDRIAKLQAKYQDKLTKKTFSERIKDLDKEYKYATTKQEKLVAANKKAGLETVQNLGKAFKAVLGNTFNNLNKGVDDYLGAYSKYMSGIEARIQGGTKSFSSITNMISRNIGSSQYVSQSKVLENLSNLVEQGILYNVENRAFLQTVADKIATTFDAANGTLLRLIKIQQADSTAARLGMEASLTQLFNKMYEDTSYLNKGGVSSSVSSAILGASSQLGRDKSLEFEYNVQKWLGSLSSVGVSDATIQSLAQGLNYLGTGDVTGLAGNSQLQNLLAISSSRAGLDYAGILNQGLTPETANVLLRSIIQYGQQIGGIESQVVKSQYAQLFGLTVSDLTALLNLTSSDLENISKSLLSYSQATAEVNSQLNQIPSRMTLKERLDTMFENIMSGVGENIANNAGMYGTYLINSMIMNATSGGIEVNVPFLGAVNLNKAIQGGIVGLGLIGELGNIISGLSGMNTLAALDWGTNDVRVRGAGFTGIKTTGITRGTSQTMYVGGTASETELYQSSFGAAADKSAETVAGQELSSQEQMTEAISKGVNAEGGLLDQVLELLRSWDMNGLKVLKSNGSSFE